MIKVELWSDFGCPFCYIGKTRFDNALSKFSHKDQVEVIYKAYQLNPNAPKEMKGDAATAFAMSHNMSPEQAKQRFKMFTDNAKTVGLEYNYDIIQMTNTFDAHRIAKYANTVGLEPQVTARFMKAYFTEGFNLADPVTLLALSKEAGLDEAGVRAVLESDQFASEVKTQIAESRQVGVQGVPFFVLDRKYGVSGAQAEEYFTQVLEYMWNEHQQLESIDGGESGHVCNDESCEM
ncbi:MAG: DsbA family oxidoreductase [Bacilli bacterium]|nr:DsbA family oxidoreductase [Bacilli bacterium]MBN2877872.1 DsbA family oxidoreductase [Bacilli bacterium]